MCYVRGCVNEIPSVPPSHCASRALSRIQANQLASGEEHDLGGEFTEETDSGCLVHMCLRGSHIRTVTLAHYESGESKPLG